MWRSLARFRLPGVNTSMLVTGVALLLVAVLGEWVTIGGNQILKGAPWWTRLVIGVVGLLLTVLAFLVKLKPVKGLRTGGGFIGAPPRMPDPDRMVERPELLEEIVALLRPAGGTVALTGMGGAGKSTLAAQACSDRRVRRQFRDGVTWMEAVPRQDPLALLAELAQCLELPASFTTSSQARNILGAGLRGKRLLIAVDNVWEREPLDALIGLSSGCMVLFTTRLSHLATTFRAAEIPVRELTSSQALRLLGGWAGQPPAKLPSEAQALCQRVENLALGVAMVGAMVAREQSFPDVLELIERDQSKIHADLDPAYPYRSLFAAIDASISSLSEADQHRYEQLVVFAARRIFPREAVEVLWRCQSELTKAEVGILLNELVGRSLLTKEDNDQYAAHDLQYEVMKRRLGPSGTSAAHVRLLDSYRSRYPGGWSDSATDLYLANSLARHLHQANRRQELQALLANAAWIEARITEGQLPGLLSDYAYADDLLTWHIARAMRLSEHVLAADPRLIRGQLLGRLLGNPDQHIADWTTSLFQCGNSVPWLAPLAQALTPTTTPLAHVLTPETVWSVAVSLDGSTAVSGGPHGIQVWNLAAGHELPPPTPSGRCVPPWWVAVSQDGTMAVSGADDGVRVWDLVEGRERARLTDATHFKMSVAISADGARAVGSGMDGSLRVWDVETGREDALLIGGHKGNMSIALSADGKTAVSGGTDGSVRVWDLEAGQHTVLTSDGGGTCVAVTADGKTAVTGGRNGSVDIWDLEDSQQKGVLTGPKSMVAELAVSADGTTAVGVADGSMHVWDLASRREKAVLANQVGYLSAVAVNANGTKAFTGGMDGARMWDLAPDQLHGMLTSNLNLVSSAAVSADGKTAVTCSRGGVQVWDLSAARAPTVLTEEPSAMSSVTVSTDGRTAVTWEPGRVRVWDLVASREQAVLTDASIESAGVSEDGKTAVTCGRGGVQVWDLAAARARTVLTEEPNAMSSVTVSTDGRRAVTHGPGRVRVWDLVANREQARFPADNSHMVSAAVSADARTLIICWSDRVEVMDLVADCELATFSDLPGPLLSMAVSPDRRTLISGGPYGVHAWYLGNGRARAALKLHGSSVQSVAIGADGRNAVSGSGDGTVRLWDLATGLEVAHWAGDHGILSCAVLTSLPLRIAVGQGSGQPYLLELRG